MKYVNQSILRIDANDKVTGKAKYPADFELENELYLKVKFAERPHALIHSIDTSLAEAISGVVLVLTAKDVPNNEYGLQIKDQPVLCGPGSRKVGGDHVRFVGDHVALVIAETMEIAEQACQSIHIHYEDLPIITNPLEAMGEGAYEIHPEIHQNIACYDRIRKGEVELAFEKADIIIENDYITPVQEHAFLQPEAGVAYIDSDDVITVVISGQWAHEDQKEIAHALDIPLEKVRVIYPAIGGAFGGREDMSLQIVLALAVKRLKENGIDRPVKSVWSREESIIGHGKRHQYRIHSKKNS